MKKHLEQAKVHIIDPSNSFGTSLRNSLEQLGYKVTAITTCGLEALQAMAGTPVDLVLVDIPEQTGKAVVKDTEQIHTHQNIPVVYLAAAADEEALKMARLTGLLGRVAKPYQDRDLFIAIEMALYNHRMEQRIKSGEERFRMLFNAMPIGFALHDVVFDESGSLRDHRFLEVNPAFETLTGLKKERLLGRTVREVFSGIENSWIDTYGRIARNGKSARLENHAPEWGKTFQIATLTPANGQCAIFLTDITEHKRAEEALRESQLELTAIYDHTPVMLFVVDAELHILRANQAVLQFTQQKAGEVKGSLLGDLLGCFHVSEASQGCGQSQACEYCVLRSSVLDTVQRGRGHRRTELKLSLVRGDRVQEIMLLLSTALINVTNKAMVLLCLEDITQHKRAEEQVREQAALLDIARDAIMVHDLSGRILLWNHGAENLYGWKVEEALGQDAEQLLYRTSAIEMGMARQQVLEREEWSGELHQVTKDQKEVVVQSRWALVRDRQGSPKSILSVGTDMTEQKKLEAQFLRAQRVETIGTLASGIAHDLNNVLAPILMAVSCLREKNPDSDTQSMLGIMETSAKRGANIIQQLLTFGRGNSGARAILHPKRLLQEMVKIGRETFPKTINLKFSLAPNSWKISGDATQLHQVLLNLCVNAIDAMPKGGILTLMVENVQLDHCFAQMHNEAKAGNYVLISVGDTGTGIPKEIIDKIFDPFFTTKAPGKGTGLGLATVANILKSHGGFIQVSSEVSKGTLFKLYFPATTSESEESIAGEQVTLARGENELVLVVDDEAAIRQVVQRILLKNNYRVLLANDGTEALAAYAQHRDEIGIVLIDLIMPHMDGSATIRVLQKLNPEVRIIAASGTLGSLQETDLKGIEVQAVLCKPYTANKLLGTLRNVLAANSN